MSLALKPALSQMGIAEEAQKFEFNRDQSRERRLPFANK
jgi:hypothetical protein